MTIGGLSIILLLGVFNFMLIIFQLSTGLRWYKVRFAIHRKAGIILLISATLHGFLAYLAK